MADPLRFFKFGEKPTTRVSTPTIPLGKLKEVSSQHRRKFIDVATKVAQEGTKIPFAPPGEVTTKFAPFYRGSPLAAEPVAIQTMKEAKEKMPPLALTSFLSPGYWGQTLQNIDDDVKEVVGGFTSFVSLLASSTYDPEIRARMFSARTLLDMGKALVDNFAEYLYDPAGKIQREPVGFVLDLTTLLQFGSGTVTKVGTVTNTPFLISLGERMRPLKLTQAVWHKVTEPYEFYKQFPLFGQKAYELLSKKGGVRDAVKALTIGVDIRQKMVNLPAKERLAAWAKYYEKLDDTDKITLSLLQQGFADEALEFYGKTIPDRLKGAYKHMRREVAQLEADKITEGMMSATRMEYAKYKLAAVKTGIIDKMDDTLTASKLERTKAAIWKAVEEGKKAKKIPSWVEDTPIYQQLVTRKSLELSGIKRITSRGLDTKLTPKFSRRRISDAAGNLVERYVLEKPDVLISRQQWLTSYIKAKTTWLTELKTRRIMKPVAFITQKGKMVVGGTDEGAKLGLAPMEAGKMIYSPAPQYYFYKAFAELNDDFVKAIRKLGGDVMSVLEGGDDAFNTQMMGVVEGVQDVFSWIKGEKGLSPTAEVFGLSRKGITLYSIPNNPVMQAALMEFNRTPWLSGIPELFSWADGMTTAWKVAVLAFSPSWFINNAIGNLMLNTFAGVKPDAYLKAFLQKFKVLVPEEEIEAGGFIRGIAQPAAEYTRYMRRGLAESKFIDTILTKQPFRLLEWGASKAYDFNAAIENYFRKAAYISKAEELGRVKLLQKGGSSLSRSIGKFEDVFSAKNLKAAMSDSKIMKKALQFTNDALNDYSRLSVFEKRFFRRYFPFYNWWKFINTTALTLPFKRPFAAQTLKLLSDTAADVRDDMWFSFGVNPEDLEDWQQEMIPVGVNEQGKIFAIAMRGANVFTSLSMLGLAQLNPAASVLAEGWLGRDLFTGRPFTRKDVIKTFGGDLWTVDPRTGEPKKVKKVTPDLLYRLFRKFPQFQFLSTMLAPYARYSATGEIIIDPMTGEPAFGLGEEKEMRMRQLMRTFGVASATIDAEDVERARGRRESAAQQILRRLYAVPEYRAAIEERLQGIGVPIE